MTDLTQAARANRRLRNGGREMIAWAGRCLRLAVRTVIRAVKMAHHEQMSMWECILLTSGAAPLTAAGPLRWGSVGGRLPARRQPPAGPGPKRNRAVTRAGGRRPDPASAPPAGSSMNLPGRRTASAAARNPASCAPHGAGPPTSGPRHREEHPDTTPTAWSSPGCMPAPGRSPWPGRCTTTAGSCAPPASAAPSPAKNSGGGMFAWRWDTALPETPLKAPLAS